jgi:hypothetical protein
MATAETQFRGKSMEQGKSVYYKWNGKSRKCYENAYGASYLNLYTEISTRQLVVNR